MNNQQKPNILLIMSDEHDPKIMGCYGDPLVQTPNLDRLAAEGITFDACYTPSPLCVPARLSFTAGKYVNRIEAWNNGSSLPSDDYPSLPQTLNASGYESYLSGKMHYEKDHRYGFKELFSSPFNIRIAKKEGKRRDFENSDINHDSWAQRVDGFVVGNNSKVLDHDRLVTEHSSRFLSSRKKTDSPFFLLAGYLAPHFPLVVPKEFYEPYRDRVPMPNLPEGCIEKLPSNYQHLRRGFGTVDIPSDVVKKGRELYWGFVSWLDCEIGKLLSAIPPEIADNTIVIYTSDHGENKGDHGLWWKNSMYEHSARVPLIVRWPSKWKGGQRRKEVCSLLDLVQTIAELGGVEPPQDWDGDSLHPLLEDANAPWKDFAVSEYFGHFVASGFTMIREGRFKYVYHTRIDDVRGPELELYDLQSDPDEFVNLSKQPEHQERIRSMHSKMVTELGCDPDEAEQRCREAVRGGSAGG